MRKCAARTAGTAINVPDGYTMMSDGSYNVRIHLQEGITSSFYGRTTSTSSHEPGKGSNFARRMCRSGTTVTTMMWIGTGVRMNPSLQVRVVSGFEVSINTMLETEYAGDPSVVVTPHKNAGFLRKNCLHPSWPLFCLLLNCQNM
jgi:hypothetical protein